MLGIEETADDEEVRAAYLAAVRRSPPDRDPEGFRRVREAYEAVRDEERRLALRLFGPAPLDRLDALLDTIPDEWTASEVAAIRRRLPLLEFRRVLDICCGLGRHVGPGPWLDLLRGDRP